MSDHLQGKTIIITGAGGGFGKVIAEMCAAQGAHIVGVDIDADGLTAVADGITATGGSAVAHVADVTDMNQMKGAAAAADGRADRVDDHCITHGDSSMSGQGMKLCPTCTTPADADRPL